MVTINGFPKAGSHAMKKAVELLGLPAEFTHQPAMSKGKMLDVVAPNILIKRDPRNIVLSWLRFMRKPLAPGMYISTLRKFQEQSFFAELEEYAPWQVRPGVYVVKFEDLVASEDTMRALAGHLSVPYLEGAFSHLPGLTATWTGKLSDWNTIWTPEIDAVWNAEGGAEALRQWGY